MGTIIWSQKLSILFPLGSHSRENERGNKKMNLNIELINKIYMFLQTVSFVSG